MANINKVILIGRLTRDPDLRYTANGTPVANLSMATNRTFGEGDQKREETTFHDVTLWAKTGELASRYLSKGSEVYIEGRLQNEEWEDKTTGEKRRRVGIVGELMQFVGSKGDSKQASPRQKPRGDGGVAPNEEIDLGDGDEIPF